MYARLGFATVASLGGVGCLVIGPPSTPDGQEHCFWIAGVIMWLFVWAELERHASLPPDGYPSVQLRMQATQMRHVQRTLAASSGAWTAYRSGWRRLG